MRLTTFLILISISGALAQEVMPEIHIVYDYEY
jgi:hypothetical protein